MVETGVIIQTPAINGSSSRDGEYFTHCFTHSVSAKEEVMIKRVLLVLILTLAMTACATEPAPQVAPPAPEMSVADDVSPAEVPSSFSEAPSLSQMVALGELPPVDERLPQEPFVVGPGVLLSEEDLPDWQPGRYDSTMRAAHSVADWSPDIFVIMNEPLLISPGLSVDNIQGNVLKDFEVSDDNRVFTFYMREGLKWSDGEFVTTEDVRFVYENILLNEQLTPSFPRRFKNGNDPNGEPMSLEIIDDYTFQITFTEPYGGFLRALTIETWVGYTELLRPSHYLKQFHPDYTSMEELRPLLDDMNLQDEWWNLFTQKNCNNWDMTNPRCKNYPALNPWIGTESSVGVLTFLRNPYYFKVDTTGQQLPYFDRIVSVQVDDVEMVNLRVLTGEVDFLRESASLVKMPLYREHEEQNGFRAVLLDIHFIPTMLILNQTYEDETWRSVVGDVRFRQAVSQAIDRQEIIESIYFGFAELPRQTMGDYANPDPASANALLDEIGMTERDSDGFRLAPNGESFTLTIEHGANGTDFVPTAALLTEHLESVGIRVQVRQVDPQLRTQRGNANELMGTIGWGHDMGWDNTATGDTLGHWGGAGRLWHLWYTTQGETGVEPPEWVMEAYDIDVLRWATIPGTDEYNELKERGLAWHREHLPMITFVENTQNPLIVSARMGNVPSGGTAIGANFAGEQFFFTE
jgi:peptide/nickel transport system substrate-binding protein